jgi:uncharacterized membrane protein YdfJ with MMPL/SSD domain
MGGGSPGARRRRKADGNERCGTLGARWSRLSRRGKLLLLAGVVGIVFGVAATLNYTSGYDRLSLIDPSNPTRPARRGSERRRGEARAAATTLSPQ